MRGCRNDHLARVTGKTQHQGGPRGGSPEQAAHRTHDDALLACAVLQMHIRLTAAEVDIDVHPLAWNVYGDGATGHT